MSTTKRKAVKRPAKANTLALAPLSRPPFGYDDDGQPITYLRRAQTEVHAAARMIYEAIDVDNAGKRSDAYRMERIALESGEAWRLLDKKMTSHTWPEPAGEMFVRARAIAAAIYRATVGTLKAPERIREKGMSPYDIFHTVGILVNQLHEVAFAYNDMAKVEATKYLPAQEA